MSEMIGRAALMVVTDKKTLQKVLTGILIVFIALFTPVIAAVEVLHHRRGRTGNHAYVPSGRE